MVVLLLLFLAGVFISQGLLLLLGWYYHFDIKATDDIFSMLSNAMFSGKIKFYIGWNHILSFLIFPFIFLMIYYKGHIKSYLSLKYFDARFIFLFMMLLICCYPLMAYIAMWMDRVDWPPFIDGMDEMALESLSKLLQMDDISGLIINLTITGIIPGITEEFLFRGIIQKEIKTVCANYHSAIWITAILFGIFHFQIIGLFPKIIIGAILGYAYQYSGSLLLPMIIHILNNSFATIAHYFNPMEDIVGQDQVKEITIFPVIIFTGIAIFLFKYIHDHHKSFQYANEQKSGT